MFSGIVEAMGTVVSLEMDAQNLGCQLAIRNELVCSASHVADSVAVNGCCLTVVKKEALEGVSTLYFDVGPESLIRTNLGDLKVGSSVNLERAVCVGDRLGGHIVSGHIDGCGELIQRDDQEQWSFFKFKITQDLARQMASKGSVAIDGVSLTLVECQRDYFTVALIPFTLEVTTLGKLEIGDRVNIETDILAKYVQRLVESREWNE